MAKRFRRGWCGGTRTRSQAVRRDDREGIPGIAAEAGRIGQQRDQFVEFPDRARPPVQEEQRQRGRADAGLMDEVQLDPRQGHRELLEGIEASLVHAPIVLVAPVLDELSQIRQVRAILPASAGNLVGPADAVQPLAQVSKGFVWDPDCKGSGLHDGLLRSLW